MHRAGPERHPLAMRAGQADQALVRALYDPQELGLFAAHDVGCLGVALRDPRQDADGALHPRHGHGLARQIGECCRRRDVGCFGPALARAGHAADHHRQVGRCLGICRCRASTGAKPMLAH